MKNEFKIQYYVGALGAWRVVLSEGGKGVFTSPALDTKLHAIRYANQLKAEINGAPIVQER